MLCGTKCDNLLYVTPRRVPRLHINRHSTLLARLQGHGGAGARGSHYALWVRESVHACGGQLLWLKNLKQP